MTTPRPLIPLLILLAAPTAPGCAFDAAPLQPPDADTAGDAALDAALDDAPEAPLDTSFIDDPQPDPQPTFFIDAPEDEEIIEIDNDLETCQAVCGFLFECLDDICEFEMVFGQDEDALVDNCVDQCVNDPSFIERAEETQTRSCTLINDGFCRQNPTFYDVCGCLDLSEEDTTVGAPCTMASDCEGGSRGGLCILGTDEMGQDTNFPGGYCTILGCDAHLDCGADNWCLGVNGDGGDERACFDACRISLGPGSCRQGYGCWGLNGFDDAGVCLQACQDDTTCPDGLSCVNSGCVTR